LTLHAATHPLAGIEFLGRLALEPPQGAGAPFSAAGFAKMVERAGGAAGL
jgi:hypothetical protein